MTRRILLIAYHFPPVAGSSGVHRTLTLARHLPEFGWQPGVLTVHSRAYPRVDEASGARVPAGVGVARAFALDSARHLSVRGRYPRWLALPDRWWTWVLGAVPAGLRLIRRERPAVLWATYPVPSALVVGLVLHRLTGIPLVADLRDSMWDASFPEHPAQRRAHAWIEARVARAAARVVFTAPGTRDLYAARYPEEPAGKWALIRNGYDEEDFGELTGPAQRGAVGTARAGGEGGGRLTLVHSGLVDPADRDPRPFLQALAGLQHEGALSPGGLEVRFRGAAGSEPLARWVAEAGLGDTVRLLPPLPYGEALAEMMGADALLLLQGATCNHQIPAKLYEYARTGRPLLALTDPRGDTAGELRGMGFGTVAPLDDAGAIAGALGTFLARVSAGREPGCAPEVARRHTRRERARELAAVLEGVSGEG